MTRRQTYISMVAVVVISLLCKTNAVLALQEPVVGLEPVEQTVADRGPLSTSLRWVQYGLREPYGFTQLYQLPIGEQNYVRRNAGLWAVFQDRSTSPRAMESAHRSQLELSTHRGLVKSSQGSWTIRNHT